MDTKDTAETTAPSLAPAKPVPAPEPAGERESEEPVPSVPLSGLGDDSLKGLRTAFSGLSVGGPEGKKKEKEKKAVDMAAREVDPAVFLGLCRAAMRMPITHPRRPCTCLGYLVMRHPSLVILCQHLVSPL